MTNSLRLLIVEDAPDDAKLLLRLLQQDGFNLQAERVDTEQGLSTAITAEQFDAVIADYNLPGFSGIRALQVVRAICPETPFVLISGQVGEEIAVEALKLGADDFLLKQNLKQLGRVLRRAINDAAIRAAAQRARLDLADSEERHRQIFQNLPNAVYTCDAQGRITMFNDAAVDLWGRTPDPATDLWSGASSLLDSQEREIRHDQCPMAVAVKEARPVFGTELIFVQPDGQRRHVLPHPQPLFDSTGQVTGAVNMVLDITDRKRYESELAQSLLAAKTLFDQNPIAQFMKGPRQPIAKANEKFCELSGYSNEELVGQHVDDLNLFSRVSELEHLRSEMDEKDEIPRIEMHFRRKDGTERLMLMTCRKMNVFGKDFRIFSCMDITEHRETARQAFLTQQCIASASEGMLISGPDRVSLSINAAFERLTGYGEAEIIGRSCAMLQGVDTDPDTVLAMRTALDSGQPFKGEILNYRKDGSSFWNELSISPVRGKKGVISHFVGFQRDVSERKNSQAQLRLSEQVFAQGKQGITVTDAQGAIVMVNEAFCKVTGFDQNEVLGRNPRAMWSRRYERAFTTLVWNTIVAEGSWEGEVWHQRKNGEEYLQWLKISALKDERGVTNHFVGTSIDITEQNAASERIDWLSNFDSLTGLPNRALLADRCAHDLNESQRTGDQVVMLAIEVARFKSVVDTLGRVESDQLLKLFGQRLVDNVGERGTVARVGGSQFVLAISNGTPEGAALLATQLQEVATKPYRVGEQDVTIQVSIGIALYPHDASDFEGLLRAAEFAMHQSDRIDGGRHSFFSAEMFESTRSHSALANALSTAIERGQLDLHYQPFVSLQTGQIAGMEALVRWHHPELGNVSPAKFIPVAEESGVIIDIGSWVVDRACADMRRWLDNGLAVVPVSVNVSPRQFHEPGTVGQIVSALQRHRIDPNLLCVEVTEGTLIEDVEKSKQLLHQIRSLGIHLSLDDFGTGYSSLSYLKLFPFHKVKIDQSFVRNISTSTEDAVIAKVVISMAHGLGLRVIAEGVETEAQCEFMRNNGCDEIQGYFFARPAPAPAVEELLRRDQRLPEHLVQVQTRQRTLLLVDDEPNVLSALKRLLRRGGYQILTANDGAEGLRVLAQSSVDIILSDQRMPGMTGVEFLRQAKVLYPDTIRIVLSGYTELQSVTDAINEGAVYRFLTKPWVDAQLQEFIAEAFTHKELADDNRQLNLKVLSANQELAAKNRQLEEVLDLKQIQIARGEKHLQVFREALQNIPVPVIATDDEGMIAFANQHAQDVFASFGPLAGNELHFAAPALFKLIDQLSEGESRNTTIDSHRYRVEWHLMGGDSESRGRIISLMPELSRVAA